VLKWGTLRERAVFNLKIRLQRAYLFFCRFTTRWWAHRIVVISGPDADYISRTKSDKFVLIHNACHLPSPERPDRMLGLGIEPRRYVLFVGRFDPRKGGHYLIEAFKGLDTNLKLVFVGGPRDSVYGRFLTRLAGSDPRILFTGPLYDKTLRELFSNAAVYAHPSESEGQSISLLEGLAYGNCVVTSDTPESVETAEDNAYYFRTGDPADLARALRDALSDPEAMERMRARAAMHVASAYQWPDKVERYEQLYSSLAG
jgi:glycosyltransferase involved in cell wall biosynthesis